MPIEAVGALGDFVFDCVEERLVVRGPSGAGDALGLEEEQRIGGEIFDFESELAETGDIGGIGEQLVVVADGEDVEAEEGMAFGEGVQV